jgi:DNA-binding transcriptional LysR family regulator
MNWDDLRIFLEVARTERLSEAARRLKMDASTVSRRLHRLEKSLSAQLFERSVEGHAITAEGQRLLQSANQVAAQMDSAYASVQGQNLEESGHVRVGATEGFGSFFIAPNLASFHRNHPQITVDLLPLPRFTRLTRHEADIAVTVERPRATSLILSRLCEYRLRLYASADYLATREPIAMDTLESHDWVGYVDELIFSDQLSYLGQVVPNARIVLGSTSVIAQWQAVRRGVGLGILPCFMAAGDSDLVALLDDDIDITRSFWLAAQPDYKRMARVERVWDYLKDMVQRQQPLLMGTG